MDEREFSRIYPRVLVVPERGLFPVVNLPEDFRVRVRKFYADKGRERVEEYTNNLRSLLRGSGNSIDIRLNWHETDGLRNISVGVHGGFDLTDEDSWPHFQEHNLGWTNGFYAAAIALEYVRELIK